MDREKTYLERYGSLSHCWRVHKKNMIVNNKPYACYASFRHRIKDLGWGLYEAIHTPANTKKRSNYVRVKGGIIWLCYKVKSFFRRLFKKRWNEKK